MGHYNLVRKKNNFHSNTHLKSSATTSSHIAHFSALLLGEHGRLHGKLHGGHHPTHPRRSQVRERLSLKPHPRPQVIEREKPEILYSSARNHFEILKMLLDRGATIPIPHDVKVTWHIFQSKLWDFCPQHFESSHYRSAHQCSYSNLTKFKIPPQCSCEECLTASGEDSLRYSLARFVPSIHKFSPVRRFFHPYLSISKLKPSCFQDQCLPSPGLTIPDRSQLKRPDHHSVPGNCGNLKIQLDLKSVRCQNLDFIWLGCFDLLAVWRVKAAG